MAARRVSEAPTFKGNFAPDVLQRSVSLPDIWRPLTSEYFTHEKQELRLGPFDTRPGSSSLPAACTETWNAGTPERRNAGTPERRNTETRNTETRNTKLLKLGTYEK